MGPPFFILASHNRKLLEIQCFSLGILLFQVAKTTNLASKFYKTIGDALNMNSKKTHVNLMHKYMLSQVIHLQTLFESPRRSKRH